jgi:hypothetical protein
MLIGNTPENLGCVDQIVVVQGDAEFPRRVETLENVHVVSESNAAGVRCRNLIVPRRPRLAAAFPEERGKFTCPNEEAAGRLSLDGGLDLPSSAWFQPAPTVSPLT